MAFMKIHLAMFLMLCLLLTACPPPDSQGNGSTGGAVEGITVRTKLLDGNAVGKATIEVFITKKDEPLSKAQVTVTGDMTHAGMSPVIATAVEQEVGRYLTEDFEFTMAGDWIITTEVKLSNGQRINDTLPLSVSR